MANEADAGLRFGQSWSTWMFSMMDRHDKSTKFAFQKSCGSHAVSACGTLWTPVLCSCAGCECLVDTTWQGIEFHPDALLSTSSTIRSRGGEPLRFPEHRLALERSFTSGRQHCDAFRASGCCSWARAPSFMFIVRFFGIPLWCF